MLFSALINTRTTRGTGRATESGTGAGKASPSMCRWKGEGDDDYRAVFQKVLVPAADAFKPELVIISAGFDAHRDDPWPAWA